MIFVYLGLRSLRNRWMSTLLTLLSVALSVFLVIGIERIRWGAQESFSNSLSKTDLVVGARGSDLQLLLYTVFHMGDATNNITFESYNFVKNHPSVEWTIPISLGDSHRGHRVVATDQNFYRHYRFQGDKSLEFASGSPAEKVFDVVVGSKVALDLGYGVGDSLVLSHGVSEVAVVKHEDKPFKVVGVLKTTGTPIDRALYITLEGMEAIHIDWQNGVPPSVGQETKATALLEKKFVVNQITSFLVRTKNRIETLQLQREINNFQEEPLMAVIPGVVLSKLWKALSYGEVALKAVSVCVALVSLIGLVLVLFTSLNERRREMAILRALGLRPLKILFLLMSEALFVVLVGSVVGLFGLYMALWMGQPFLLESLGIFFPITFPTGMELYFLAVLFCATALVSFFPAFTAYRKSLHDGLSVRI